MSTSRPIRRGFTLVELLVVSGVVVLLLVLVLPAVVQARELQRTQMCRHNLKQLGLAFHNYNDVYNCLPPGWIVKDDEPETGPGYSWQVSILPFVDQAPIYNQINFHQSPAVEIDHVLAQRIEIYRCPEDRAADADEDRDGFGVSNYAGNYGVDPFPGNAKAAKTGAQGVFHWNSSVRFNPKSKNGIKDGLSNTLFVGERNATTGAGLWAAARSNEFAVDVVATANHGCRITRDDGAYSSEHGEGAHFLYGDGAVRFISDQIDSSAKLNPPEGLFQKLAQINDGQEVDLNESTE